MLKKSLILLFAILSVSVVTLAQIAIAPSKSLYDMGKDEFKPADLAQFRRSVTHFVYLNEHADKLDAFEKILAANWTVTKYKLIPFEDIEKYASSMGNSFFSIAAFHKEGNPLDATSISSTNVFYCLWMPTESGRGKVKPLYLARLIMHHDVNESRPWLGKKSEDILSYYHNKATFHNGDLGHMQTYLKYLNTELLKPNPHRKYFDEEINKKEIKALRTKTLLIPSYCLDKVANYFAKQDDLDPKVLLAEYKYKYRVVSPEELNKSILESTEPVYYLVYIRSNTDKYITVFNSKNGSLLYSEYEPVSYNLKPKDFKELREGIIKN